MTEPTDRDRDMAKAAFRRWGPFGYYRADLIDNIASELAAAREEGRREERERCAEIAREWIHGSPTTTTEHVVKEIVTQIRFGPSPNLHHGGIECVPHSELHGIDAAVAAERERLTQMIIDISRETLPEDDAHALCFEIVDAIKSHQGDTKAEQPLPTKPQEPGNVE